MPLSAEVPDYRKSLKAALHPLHRPEHHGVMSGETMISLTSALSDTPTPPVMIPRRLLMDIQDDGFRRYVWKLSTASATVVKRLMPPSLASRTSLRRRSRTDDRASTTCMSEPAVFSSSARSAMV
jgi:hypothetical protein